MRDPFGRLGRIYHLLEMAWSGRELRKMREAFLGDPDLVASRSVLIFGEGDGRFLKAALEAWPQAQFRVVDQSAGMISMARRRIIDMGYGSRVRFDQADVIGWECDEAFDGVVMHCFLDCFDDRGMRHVLKEAKRGLSTGGWVWVGDYVEPLNRNYQWLRLRCLYKFFQYVTDIRARRIPDYATWFEQNAFEARRCCSFGRGSLNSCLYFKV